MDASDEFRQAVESEGLVERVRDRDGVYVDCEQAMLGNLAAPWRDLQVDLQNRLQRNDQAMIGALDRAGWVLHRQLRGIIPVCSSDSLNLLVSRWYAALLREVGAEEVLDQALSTPGENGERIAAIHEIIGSKNKEARSSRVR